MRARRGIVEILRAHCYWRCMAPEAAMSLAILVRVHPLYILHWVESSHIYGFNLLKSPRDYRTCYHYFKLNPPLGKPLVPIKSLLSRFKRRERSCS